MNTRSSLRAVPQREEQATPSPASHEPNGPPPALIGECLNNAHPTLLGRALVRWSDGRGSTQERWLPTLMTVTVRASDRVLLLLPGNSDEPVIIGVLDGFAQRPAAAVHGGPTLELQQDEVVRVQDSNGVALLELASTPEGPLVRLLQADVNVELPGALQISARSIELSARQGEVNIHATDDVALTGAGIRLN